MTCSRRQIGTEQFVATLDVCRSKIFEPVSRFIHDMKNEMEAVTNLPLSHLDGRESVDQNTSLALHYDRLRNGNEQSDGHDFTNYKRRIDCVQDEKMYVTGARTGRNLRFIKGAVRMCQ